MLQIPVHKLPRIKLCLTLLLAAALVIFSAVCLRAGEPKLRRHLFIQGVPVGGLTRNQALVVLKDELNSYIGKPILIISSRGADSFFPLTLGLTLDIERAVTEAMAVSRETRWHFWRCRIDLPLWPDIDQAQLAAGLSDLRQAIRAEPRDAVLHIGADDTVWITGEEWGQDIDFTLLAEDLQHQVMSPGDRSLNLPILPLPPRLGAAELAARGVTRLLSKFTTTFEESNLNRSSNIRVGIEAIREYWLEPGGVFSYNAITARSENASRYREAPIYLQGRIVQGIGGGICQVSSTLYNAAILADLAIEERHPHSLTVPYVSPGRDATVSEGSADLKFRNSTPAHILIVTDARQGRLTVRIFGTEGENKTVSIVHSILKTREPAVRYIEDPNLAIGEQVVEQTGKKGYQVQTWKIIQINGEEITRTPLAVDTYQPLERVIRTGTRPVPAGDSG